MYISGTRFLYLINKINKTKVNDTCVAPQSDANK